MPGTVGVRREAGRFYDLPSVERASYGRQVSSGLPDLETRSSDVISAADNSLD